MVYLKTLSSFMEAVEKIYSESPTQTRYTVKFNRDEGNMVLKVTDDKTVVSFKTTDASDLKKIDDLSARFLLMCVEKDYDEEELKEAHKEVSAAQHAERTKKQQSQQGKRPGAGGQSKAKRKR